MSDLSAMTAASMEITLGGNTYQLAPITIGDLGQIEQWMRDNLADTMGKLMKHCVGAAEKAILIAEIAEAVSALYWGKPGCGYLHSPELALRVLHLSMAKKKPDITLQDIDAAISQEPEAMNRLQEIALRISQVSGISPQDDDDKEAADAVGDKKSETGLGRDVPSDEPPVQTLS